MGPHRTDPVRSPAFIVASPLHSSSKVAISPLQILIDKLKADRALPCLPPAHDVLGKNSGTSNHTLDNASDKRC
jgi:hypothetical protein